MTGGSAGAGTLWPSAGSSTTITGDPSVDAGTLAATTCVPDIAEGTPGDAVDVGAELGAGFEQAGIRRSESTTTGLVNDNVISWSSREVS
jgi:hypothetical protein